MDGFKQQESSIKSGARLHYGPGLLRLIESPDFRLHFEKEAWPAATKRLSGVQKLVTDELRSTAETGESDAEETTIPLANGFRS
jgi:hypothetical protein